MKDLALRIREQISDAIVNAGTKRHALTKLRYDLATDRDRDALVTIICDALAPLIDRLYTLENAVDHIHNATAGRDLDGTLTVTEIRRLLSGRTTTNRGRRTTPPT